MPSEIGHNKPPSMCFTAGEVAQDLSRWMAEHPVVQTDAEAKEAKVLLDRSDLCVKDMEDERKAQVTPHNEAVKEINRAYAAPRELLEQVHVELQSRVDRFLVELEAEREATAAAAFIERERLEGLAREAEQRELDAKRDAACGELGIDVAGITANADAAFAYFKAAERAHELAERAKKVKVTGGFKRALTLRDVEIPWIDEPVKVIADLEKHNLIPERLMDYILTAANNFKRKLGRYPEGIKVDMKRRS